MVEVRRIAGAQTAAEVLGLTKKADDAAFQKAWKRLVFMLHPDKLMALPAEEQASAAEALHAVHKAKEEYRESQQASGAVDVPEQPQAAGKPTCTRSTPGQRRYEIRWLVPDNADRSRPIEKYEVYGPHCFSHTGEPMEWVLLATLPKLEACFVFVEESPTQQEVMWAGDRMRVPAVPLTVYGCNGRGKSEALYFNLPWHGKFPWLQGHASMLCRECCTVQLRVQGKGDKVQCIACGAWLAPASATIVLRCPKCHGEALWDNTGARLDCRLCGRNVATAPKGHQRRDRLGAQSVPPDRGRH